MSQTRVTTRSSRPLWTLAALSLLMLCSCRAAPWQMPAEGQVGELPNGRFLSSWDRFHGGKGPKRETYTHQPRPVEAPPPLPVPVGPPTSHESMQAAYNAPPLPTSAYRGVNYEVMPTCGREECPGCPSCRHALGQHRGLHGHDAPFPNPGMDPNFSGPECIRMPDEYICDGGDREVNVSVLPDWTVRGIDTEDTIAHYDTTSGKTVVETSNRVCIYAPRFAAVRAVKGISATQQNENLIAARDQTLPHQDDTDMIVTTSVQHVQPRGQFGLRPINVYEQRDQGIPLQKTYVAGGLTQGFLPHEDFKLLRHGIADLAEKPRLANMIDNAIVWTGDASVKVAIDGKLPVEASNNFAAEQLYVYDFGESRLRIVKTASKQNAKPGEIIDFTLRFDNIGDQTVGNVTVIDSLTTRLEYVEGSVQSSVASDFYTQANEGDSLVLRFEVVDPVKVGQGGVIRFQARVR
jgi:uncharacterized repeat protein (TIGR01451 family)